MNIGYNVPRNPICAALTNGPTLFKRPTACYDYNKLFQAPTAVDATASVNLKSQHCIGRMVECGQSTLDCNQKIAHPIIIYYFASKLVYNRRIFLIRQFSLEMHLHFHICVRSILAHLYFFLSRNFGRHNNSHSHQFNLMHTVCVIFVYAMQCRRRRRIWRRTTAAIVFSLSWIYSTKCVEWHLI